MEGNFFNWPNDHENSACLDNENSFEELVEKMAILNRKVDALVATRALHTCHFCGGNHPSHQCQSSDFYYPSSYENSNCVLDNFSMNTPYGMHCNGELNYSNASWSQSAWGQPSVGFQPWEEEMQLARPKSSLEDLLTGYLNRYEASGSNYEEIQPIQEQYPPTEENSHFEEMLARCISITEENFSKQEENFSKQEERIQRVQEKISQLANTLAEQLQNELKLQKFQPLEEDEMPENSGEKTENLEPKTVAEKQDIATLEKVPNAEFSEAKLEEPAVISESIQLESSENFQQQADSELEELQTVELAKGTGQIPPEKSDENAEEEMNEQAKIAESYQLENLEFVLQHANSKEESRNIEIPAKAKEVNAANLEYIQHENSEIFQQLPDSEKDILQLGNMEENVIVPDLFQHLNSEIRDPQPVSNLLKITHTEILFPSNSSPNLKINDYLSFSDDDNTVGEEFDVYIFSDALIVDEVQEVDVKRDKNCGKQDMEKEAVIFEFVKSIEVIEPPRAKKERAELVELPSLQKFKHGSVFDRVGVG